MLIRRVEYQTPFIAPATSSPTSSNTLGSSIVGGLHGGDEAAGGLRSRHTENRETYLGPGRVRLTLQRQSAGEPCLEIQHAHPFGCDRDSHHRRNHLSHSRNPGVSLFSSEVALGRDRVFGHDSFYRFHARGASNQQHFMRKSIVVDG